jgi:hypothetical protein
MRNYDKADRGWLRNGRSDMLSPPFKVAADLQATAEQIGGFGLDQGGLQIQLQLDASIGYTALLPLL